MNRQLVYLAILSRGIVIVLSYLTSVLFESFDQSGYTGLANWDSMHFIYIAMNGYNYEHLYAFFPLLPLLIRGGSKILGLFMNETYASVVSGVIVTHASFLLAVLYLYRLTFALFKDRDFAYYSCVFFILNPASIFLSAVYTESLYIALTFAGMYYAATNSWVKAAILFSLSCATRSNGSLCVGFILFPLVQSVFPWKLSFSRIVKTLTLCAIIVFPLIVFQLYAKSRICSQDSYEFCSSLFPNVYGFVQKKYWNVGLFNYYEVKQIPNFALAGPMLFLTVLSIYKYISANPARVFSVGLRRGFPTNSKFSLFQSSDNILVHMYHLIILVISCVTVIHIQVATRFLATSPCVYWFVADEFQKRSRVSVFYQIWSCVYIVVGTILFSLFLPWT